MIHTKARTGVSDPRLTQGKPDVVDAVKLEILKDRLTLSDVEAIDLLNRLKADAAKQLGIPPSTLEIDFEFYGRELDFTITANMQNLPPTRSTRS